MTWSNKYAGTLDIVLCKPNNVLFCSLKKELRYIGHVKVTLDVLRALLRGF